MKYHSYWNLSIYYCLIFFRFESNRSHQILGILTKCICELKKIDVFNKWKMSFCSNCLKKEFNHDVGTLGNICNKPVLIFGFLIK